MHLLELESTNIYNTNPMLLRILNVDDGDLDNLQVKGFEANRRSTKSDLIISRKIFNTNDAEDKDQARVLDSCRVDMSYHVQGGAGKFEMLYFHRGKQRLIILLSGTGKTSLLVKKVAAASPHIKILVVTRSFRLISMIKNEVGERRKEGLDNVFYCQYKELMEQLSRFTSQDERGGRSFGQFEQVKFDAENSQSFIVDFVQNCLTVREKKILKKLSIDPLTLWRNIVTIKSQSSVVETKEPLSLGECAIYRARNCMVTSHHSL